MIKIVRLLPDMITLFDQDGNELFPYLLDNGNDDYVFLGGSAKYLSGLLGKNIYSMFRKSRYCIAVDEESNEDMMSMLHTANVLGLNGYISYKKIETSLILSKYEKSDERLDIYSSRYMSPEVMKEFTKDYGSNMIIGGVTISPSKLRADRRVFGLKFADPGIYKDLVYLDFHNFYPNLMLELGCPARMSRAKIKMLLDAGNCKFTLNKLIGRMDTEYSIFYDPEYANDLRNFGRLKLLHYISKCDHLVLTNTDSILAKVSERFELPENVTFHKISDSIVKNIGNYVMIDEDGKEYVAGTFRKPEELLVAKLRMGIDLDDEEFKIDTIFHNGQDGYLSVNDSPVIGLDRKCHYGVSSKLSKESLMRFQNGL